LIEQGLIPFPRLLDPGSLKGMGLSLSDFSVVTLKSGHIF
jgi:hypothetical protein